MLRLQEEHQYRMIFFSSAEVYGDYDGLMSDDVMQRIPINQMNDYSISKWAGELQCLNHAEMFQTETVRVRPVGCYGPHEYYSPYRGVIPIFVYSALTGRPFTVHGTELFVRARAGISIFPFDANEPRILLQHADAAHYQAKEPGSAPTRGSPNRHSPTPRPASGGSSSMWNATPGSRWNSSTQRSPGCTAAERARWGPPRNSSTPPKTPTGEDTAPSHRFNPPRPWQKPSSGAPNPVFPPARLLVLLNVLSPRLGDLVIRTIASWKK